MGSTRSEACRQRQSRDVLVQGIIHVCGWGRSGFVRRRRRDRRAKVLKGGHVSQVKHGRAGHGRAKKARQDKARQDKVYKVLLIYTLIHCTEHVYGYMRYSTYVCI